MQNLPHSGTENNCSSLTQAIENPRIWPIDSNGEGDREISVGWFYPSTIGGCSGSEPICTSASRSSKSASIDSLSNEESKRSKSVCERSQEYSSSSKDMPKEELIGASPVLEPTSISGEPLLSLKLGKRLCFEHLCQGSDTLNLTFSVAPIPLLTSGKKCKSTCQSPRPPRCQVEGCSLDLSSAKNYHRKHKICGSHSKSPKVVVGGLEHQFCQQCSRLHSLSEFDGKKRSCHRRLSNHPLCLYHHTLRQRMSLFAYPRAAANLAWEDKTLQQVLPDKRFSHEARRH